MIALILAAVLSADAPHTAGCTDDEMQLARESGLKKLLSLETMCPVEKIDVGSPSLCERLHGSHACVRPFLRVQLGQHDFSELSRSAFGPPSEMSA